MRLVYIGIGWVAGIILAASFPSIIPLFWLIALGVATTLASFVRDTPYFWWMMAVLAIVCGGFRYSFVPQTSDLAQYNDVGSATIEGVIVAEPDFRDDRLQIRLAAETIQFGAEMANTSGLILVNAPRVNDVAYGDRIQVTGLLTIPATYDTFSYSDFLAREGIYSVMELAIVEVINHDEGNPLFAWLLDSKNHLMNRVNDALPDPESALLIGILLGNERGIDPKLSEAFTRVGASHVIAISGFNMAIIAGLVMGILEKPFNKRKWIATVIGVLVLAIYTLLVGANAAVVRAAIMSSMVFIAPQLNRRSYIPASLVFVALVMSAQNPLVLWDLSFQLSFFAVLGLVLFTEPLERQFKRLLHGILPNPIAERVGAFLNEPIVVSIAALIMTMPLIILYFGRLSLVSLLVNLLIVPVQALILLCGGLALIIAIFAPSLAQIFFWLDLVLLRWTIGVVRYFGDFAYADIEISLPSYLVWGFFVAIIGGSIVNVTRPKWAIRAGYWLQKNPILPTLSLAILGLLILFLTILTSRPDGRLHVWFLDVGHSNAVLIQTPNGSQILVDGGRFPSRLLTSIGDRVPFYDRELELLIMTHPDEFDLGALPSVLRRYEIGAVLTNGQDNLSDTYQNIQSALSTNEIVPVVAGYTVELDDGTLIEVLHPQTTPDLSTDISDAAMVLRVSYGDVSFLLTSDVSQGGQIEMLESGQWIGASVMQLPQHGTTRSLNGSFYNAVQPQVVIAQYDEANRRGDPDSDVLFMLGDVPLFVTGDQGTLHLSTDGRTLWAISEDV
ncbi:MAG: ComEC/Rec2 family competence protein [Phototrophicaceae bacterium]